MTSAAAFLILSALLLQTPQSSSGKRSCTLKHSGCTYNIRLSHGRGRHASKETDDCGGKDVQVVLDGEQNDYGSKIGDMEKNFSFLKDAHEQRIKELESNVKELLGLDKTMLMTPKDDDNEEIIKAGFTNIFNNDVLMKGVQAEFQKVRRELKRKNEELTDIGIKLNDTYKVLHEAQLEHFKTSQELFNAENEMTVLRRERAVLKNQLKDRNYKLEVSSQKANECEVKTTSQQDQIVKLIRSENILKEELQTVLLALSKSKQELEVLQLAHASLEAEHERTKYVKRIRELDLIDCFTSKTSTFCGFEDPKLCGFTNINDTSDFFDWEWGRGHTPSSGTGPSKDHTCDGPNGRYMFIEASAKARGSNAILYSPLYRGMSEQCVEFFYHMKGRHIGTLNVYAQARGDVLKTAWRAYGNQGDVWTNARLAIPQELAMAGYQIAFEGITENGYQGDISIDDVSVTDGPCPVDEKIVPVRVAVSNVTKQNGEEEFNKNLRKRRVAP